VFSASISNPTAVTASSSYTVVAYSDIFSVWGTRLGIRQQLLNLAIRKFRLL